jgi:hypothetical protein
MQHKSYVFAAVVAGGLLLAVSATAQTTPTAQQPETNNHGHMNGQASGTCPPGCVPVTRHHARARVHHVHVVIPSETTSLRSRVDSVESGLSAERTARELGDQQIQDQLRAEIQRREELDRNVASRFEQNEMRFQQFAATRPPTPYRRRTHIIGGGPLVDGAGFYRRPMFTFTADVGGAGFGGNFRNVVHSGPIWGARVGLDFSDWLGIEARYIGMFNKGVDTVSEASSLLSGGAAQVRLTAPIPYVRLYGFGGVGFYHHNVVGNSIDRQNSPILNSTSGGIPVGGGLELPITRYFAIGAEGGYTFYFSSNLTNNPATDQGGFWNASGLLRFRL